MEEHEVVLDNEQVVSIHEFMEGIEAQQLGVLFMETLEGEVAVIQKNQEADLVLGGDEGKECTYEKGYMRRQAVFSCLTCTPAGNAGFCTACSFACHDGHEVPRDEDGEPTFDELICQSCVRRCSFLEEYPELIASPVEVEDDEAPPSQDSEAPKVADVSTAEAPPTQTSVNKKPYTNGLTLETALGGRPVPSVEENGKAEKLEVSSTNHVGESSGSGGSVCKLKRTSQAESALTTSEEKPEETTSVGLKVLDSGRAVFLAKSWRTELCQCDACKAMYMAKGIEFLLDKEDTLQEYEESAKRKREEAKEKEDGTTQAFLQKLGHVQRIELVHGINNLATELESFLTPFGQSGKTVTSDDIYEFFDGLRKKRRVD
ncbi:hypothetical protein AXG93_3617s1000 [Marchantia polymorpha subsp. ruderalis]|uniref:UBR-type domain-containing protein n=1 Tax=Marchantia polymorpha subsp. ruderalis TaxID=1480154 RepID=A0A176WEY6_MARPO|nr:hypothetical protein AXG93_3617s1000 [Marchantia polymorpha subsp. ruderalis]